MKIKKVIEVANKHGMSYDEAYRYVKKYHPDWLKGNVAYEM